ncbi:MAG: 30S ribosomal protein S11 [Candidatus Lambdaproteobacteria bacterium RIFOXYD1_FULL_56_27]|uniref:Small ribosomal subunit protein uS11 n=1 Tax=Candidatus Lambdaproteobacteria bacterium RIFOXYD2_FULL_56_26 TaxID=1817773 RepID=A0A1F6GMN5_9PROT|nr:MAG: 30S ribosomal protein S11 [Candidatus Lambdaproteobacteria bacterium RIFOXYD2_FULL_56_26]OGH05621.1 MAG: 30S ribosomal protein S11 [Candidatus Lambdaproteobacteria bacterium RIFOXYC1_FULL_56_13]OGH08581.1 MAG: 30S ribosomal protein S11 [Candidatus Lambdaproteobacteria bacterium RIFOXYD1_FULL_56_27]
MAKAVKRKGLKKKEKKNVATGIVYISATFNNTIVSVTDPGGNVLAWSSTGLHGFKGSRKSTPYAARLVGEDAIKKAMENGMKQCDIIVKGPGSGRESALRAVANSGIRVNHIEDVTPVPHNGCRPPKRRRI